MVTATYASTVNPTSVNDVTAYERNIVVMQQLYAAKSGNECHMLKLLKMTHDVRRSKINNSALSAVAIKEEYPFFGHKKWVCKIQY